MSTGDAGVSNKLLRDAMTFIDRIGFPIFAFLMMSVICFYSLDRMNKAIYSNTQAIGEFSKAFSTFQGQVFTEHKAMYEAVLKNGR